MDRADDGTWDTGEWSVQEPERLGGKQSEGQEGHLGGGLVKPARSGRYKERPSAEPGGAQDTGSVSPANPLPSLVTSSRRRGPSGPGGGAGEDRAGYGERRLAQPCCVTGACGAPRATGTARSGRRPTCAGGSVRPSAPGCRPQARLLRPRVARTVRLLSITDGFAFRLFYQRPKGHRVIPR